MFFFYALGLVLLGGLASVVLYAYFGQNPGYIHIYHTRIATSAIILLVSLYDIQHWAGVTAHGRVVLVVGESGVGKSTLIANLQTEIDGVWRSGKPRARAGFAMTTLNSTSYQVHERFWFKPEIWVYQLIDTRGFGDFEDGAVINGKKIDISKSIRQDVGSMTIGVHCFLLLIKLDRMLASTKESLSNWVAQLPNAAYLIIGITRVPSMMSTQDRNRTRAFIEDVIIDGMEGPSMMRLYSRPTKFKYDIVFLDNFWINSGKYSRSTLRRLLSFVRNEGHIPISFGGTEALKDEL